ncbi:MAG: ribosome silencing factor [Chromatiales bacterium]|jgi:ribosome-associated protein|nr:ribosome silencing factor [Chromatiales bacterium]
MTISSEALCRTAVDALDELKGVEVKVLDVTELTGVTDYMIVANGRSDRQVKALAENVVMRAKEAGIRPLGIEGMNGAEWVLVDLCDVVVHVMNVEARETYQLEKLWARPARVREGRAAELEADPEGATFSAAAC